MLASKQLRWDKLGVETAWDKIPTSNLLEECGLCCFIDPSAPFYLPIGQKILRKLTEVIDNAAATHDLVEIVIPILTKDDCLLSGEKIDGGFADQIMRLTGAMGGYHLLFTPEPVVLRLVGKDVLSHRQLPLRFCYHSEAFRALTAPKGVLKSREFRVFMAATLDADFSSLRGSLEVFRDMTLAVLTKLHVPNRVVERQTGINIEFYYFGSEGECLRLPVAGPDEGPCMSLAMAYHYWPQGRIPIRFQDASNRKRHALMTTYGLGVQRLFYAVCDSNKDGLGFNLPPAVRPFEVAVIPRRASDEARSLQLYDVLRRDDISVLLDNRVQHSPGRRAAFADQIGVPRKVLVSGQTFKIKPRGSEEVLTFNSDTYGLSTVIAICKGTGSTQMPAPQHGRSGD